MNRTINVELRITSHVVDAISRNLRFKFSNLTFNSLPYSAIGGKDDVQFQFAVLSAPLMWMGANVFHSVEKELEQT